MNVSSRFFKGSTLNLVHQGVRVLSVFIMTPVIVGSLGLKNYGYWVFLMSIFVHYNLLGLGLSFSISRFFSRAIGKEDYDELNAFFNTAIQFALYIMLVALLVTAGLYFICPRFLDSTDKLGVIRLIVALYGVFVSTGFVIRVLRALLKSHLRHDLLVYASLIQIILANCLIYVFLKRGYGLEALAIINVGAGFLEYILVTVFSFGAVPKLRLGFSMVSRKRRREFLGFSLTAFFTSLGNTLRFTVDPLILGAFVGVTSVSYYNIGSRIPKYFEDLISAVMGSQILVILSQLHGKNQEQLMKKRFIQATRLTTILAVIGGFSILLYGGDFLERWMGEGFDPSRKILLILAIPFSLSLMQYPSRSILYTTANHAYLAKVIISAGLFNVVLSIILVQFYGLYGVVWATCVEMTIVFLIVLPAVVCRVCQIPASALYLRALAIPAAKTLLVLLPVLLLTPLVKPSYPHLAGIFALQSLYLAPLVLWFVLGPEERALVAKALPPRFRFLAQRPTGAANP